MGESQQLQSFMIPGGGYGYTGAAIDDIQSVTNTLAAVLFDESGSTRSFSRQMELASKKIIAFLRMCPEADNLIFRQDHFDTDIKEVIGWTPLAGVEDDVFDGCWAGGGCTALYYSEDHVSKYMQDYAHQLAQQRYISNGIICTMTDGGNYTPAGPGNGVGEDVAKKAFAELVANEDMESIVSILIGINPAQSVQDELQRHADEVGYTRYLPVEKADEATLAKIADFISKSIQSQSQALKTGGPSTKIGSLTF